MAVQRIQELIGLMQKNLECSICLELMTSPVSTTCGHYFCRYCLTEFLGKKRSMPCPLCKQPITKRSLQKKGELNNIIGAVSSLISAFQQDSGLTYCPPSGPQTFFPSTPDTISSKPVSHQVKGRRNVRRSTRANTQTAEDPVTGEEQADASLASDHRLAVPPVSRLSDGDSTERSSPSTTKVSTFPPSVRTDAETSRRTRGRPRSKPKAAASATVTSDSDINDQLLRCLDQNSFGLQQDTWSVQSVSGEQENCGERTEADEHVSGQGGGTEETASTRRGQGCPLGSDQQPKVHRNEPVEESQVQASKAMKPAEDTDLTENKLTDGEKNTNNKKELVKGQLEADSEKNLSKHMTTKKAKNLQTRPEVEKENWMESRKKSPVRMRNEDGKPTGLPGSSQQSSDDGSGSSTQHLQRPLPLVTKTYSRRSGQQVTAVTSVEDWMGCLPSDRQVSGHSHAHQHQHSDHDKKSHPGCSRNNNRETREKNTENIAQDDAMNTVNIAATEGGEIKKGTMNDISNQEEDRNQVSAVTVPEEPEEFMLTPPVRKKPIFKRKNAKDDQDAVSRTVQESSPPADPYVFVVGHTPVAKSKKRGRPRSKEKTGNPPPMRPFSWNIDETKNVRFSDASSERIPHSSSVTADKKESATKADDSITASRQAQCWEKPQDLLFPDSDCEIVGTENDAEAAVPPFVKPATRSRRKTQKEMQSTANDSNKGKKRVSGEKIMRRKVGSKEESPEERTARDAQTNYLASWIGQAEDYDLLFSTQEAQASMESMHGEEEEDSRKESASGKKDGQNNYNDNETAIALMDDNDESSNDGVCLIGPVDDERPFSVQSSQQNAKFDIIAEGHSHSSDIIAEGHSHSSDITAEGHSHSAQNTAESSVRIPASSARVEPTERNDASGNSKAPVDSASVQKKHSATPEMRKQESPKSEFSVSSRYSPSGGRKKVDTVPETQLSTPESPASCNVVFPSPAAGRVVLSFRTPVLQLARKTRLSTRPGQARLAGRLEGSGQRETLVEGVSLTAHSTKQQADRAPDAPQTTSSVQRAEDGSAEQTFVAASLNSMSPSVAVKAKGKAVSPLSTTTDGLRPKTDEGTTGGCTAPESATQPPQRVAGRLRTQKRGSRNNSPFLTVIPSTFTEDSVPAGAKDQEGRESQEVVPAPEASGQLVARSTAEGGAAGCGHSATQGAVRDGGGGRCPDPEAAEVRDGGRGRCPGPEAAEVSALQQSGNDDAGGDGDSSSTEDLDIHPAEQEFEEADMTLQAEDMEQSYSDRQSTQKDDSESPDFTPEADAPPRSKMSPAKMTERLHRPSEPVKDGSEQVVLTDTGAESIVDEEICEERPKSSFINLHNDQNVDLVEDSAVTQCAQSVPSVTHIPETLETEEANTNRKLMAAVSETQDGGKEAGAIETWPKATPTSSSTQGENVSQSDTASLPVSLSYGSKPSSTSSLTTENRTSSASATPSQSILQPVTADQCPAMGQCDDSAPQSESMSSPSQSILLVAGHHTASVKGAGLSEGRGEGVPTLADSHTATRDQHEGPEHTVRKKNSSAQRHTSSLASSEKTIKCGGKKGAAGTEHISQVQAEPELLVLDTQSVPPAEGQSVSLLSPQLVLDSMPECRDSSQPSGRERNPQISLESVNVCPETCLSLTIRSSGHSVEVCPETCLSPTIRSPGHSVEVCPQSYSSPSLKSPRQKPSGSEHAKGASLRTCAGKSLNKASVRSSPSSVSPGSRKRKLHEDDGEDDSLGAHQSDSRWRSSAGSKVVYSAPPPHTALDSDDVLVVRRTKRKCFSLGGSPLETKTPVSVKRRSYQGQKNLAEEFDKEADSAAKQSSQELNLSQRCRKPEKDQPESFVGEDEADCSNRKRTSEGRGDSDSVKTHTRPKASPSFPRKKTVRGLARRKAESSQSAAQNKDVPKTLRTPAAYRAEQFESETKTSPHSSEEDLSGGQPASSEGHLASQRQVLVQFSNDLDLMEMDDAGILADSGKLKFVQEHEDAKEAQLASQLQTRGGGREEAAVWGGSAGTATKPIMVTDTSDHSQTQKPQCGAQSSVPASEDDATIPPPSFDLGFEEDEEDDEDQHAHRRGDLEETSKGVTSEQGKSNYGSRHLDSLVKGNLANAAQRSESTTTAEKRADRGDGAASIEMHGQTEAVSEMHGQTEAVSEMHGQTEAVSEMHGQTEAVRELAVSPGVVSSAGSEKRVTSSEEEAVGVRKKKPAVIVSDSDNDSDHDSDKDSEASLQLHLSPSSTLSTQSEYIDTQERNRMAVELERLRKEIADMEARLQDQTAGSCSQDGDGKDDTTAASIKADSASALTSDSSDDGIKELSDDRGKGRGKTRRSTGSRDNSASCIKRPRRRRQRISSDEDEEEKSKRPKQQLMDSYICGIKTETEDAESKRPKQQLIDSYLHDDVMRAGKDPVSAIDTEEPPSPVSSASVSPFLSDEDSGDLFLRALSPSPSPPTKATLAHGHLRRQPQPLFSLDSPVLTGTCSITKTRRSLEFVKSPPPDQKESVGDEDGADDGSSHTDLPPDSQGSSTGPSGTVKRILESQFSDRANKGQESDCERSQQGSVESASRENLTASFRENLSASNVDDVESSGSPLPSPLKNPVLNVGEENKENVDQEMEEDVDDEIDDDDDLPRWKRKTFGFISSGLDQEKLGLLRKLAEANECKVYSKFNDYITHVIMKTEEGGSVCERTLKYFQGIAGQCWVVSFDWVLHCLSEGRFVPEKPFEIQGDTVKGKDHGGPSLSRLASRGLLEGFAFAPVGASSDMTKRELGQLLLQCGGEVVEDPWALADHQAPHRLVLRCVDSEAAPPTPAEIELFNGQYRHFGLVTVAREWILDSVCTHRLQALSDYVFNTCPHLQLPI